jgi:hypothetical protein
MTRQEILDAIRPYFDVDELVCPHTFAKWGQASWQFLDTDYLHALLVVRRDILKKPMWCNGSGKTERGLRCNRCSIVRGKSGAYLSAHVLGKAGDFTVTGMTAEQARQAIKRNASLLPCNIRIEKGVSWLHLDVLPQHGVTAKVYEFSA